MEENTILEEVMEGSETEQGFLESNKHVIGYVLTSLGSMTLGYGIRMFQDAARRKKQLKEIANIIDVIGLAKQEEKGITSITLDGKEYNRSEYDFKTIAELQSFIMTEVLDKEKNKEIKQAYRNLLFRLVSISEMITLEEEIEKKTILNEN